MRVGVGGWASTEARERRFRLRPRRLLAPALITAFGVAVLAMSAAQQGAPRAVSIVLGVAILALMALYAASPAWRTFVLVDERGCAVAGPRGERLRIGWDEVSEVQVDEAEGACWIDGGEARRILIPSRGMHTGYVVVRHAEATRAVCDRVPSRVRRVERLAATLVEPPPTEPTRPLGG